jgi:NAD(P)-dependent dehydrogenase (short-subunit alcohol dehydrogenase family)
MQFADKSVIITGAASGIGAATARLLASRGARVVLVDIDGEGLDGVASEIESEGGSARAYACDVADAAAAESCIASTLKDWRRIDSLALCAAISTGGGTVATLSDAQWERVFQVNVMGTVRWVRAALPNMIAAGGGTIVTMASQLAFNSGGNNCAYIASKGAIVSFTKTTAVDYAKDGIRINTVAPAVIDTPMSRASQANAPDPEAMMAWRLARHPMGRIGHVDEVARAIAFLASDESSFTTGTVQFVDGGWTAA